MLRVFVIQDPSIGVVFPGCTSYSHLVPPPCELFSVLPASVGLMMRPSPPAGQEIWPCPQSGQVTSISPCACVCVSACARVCVLVRVADKGNLH